MSSAQSGSQAAPAPAFQLLGGSMIQTDKGTINVGTSEGAALAAEALDTEDMQELNALMEEMGFVNTDNKGFKARDRLRRQQHVIDTKGPTDSKTGQTEDEKQISEVFVQEGFPSPYHAETTAALYTEKGDTPEFKTAVTSMRNFFADPSPHYHKQVLEAVDALWGSYQGQDYMGLLFLVFRESIKETNEDKRYFLLRLKEMNKISEGLSEYMEELAEVSEKMAKESEKMEDSTMHMVSARDLSLDLNAVGVDGKYQIVSDKKTRYNSMSLADKIKTLEAQKETVRHKRSVFETSFKNFDQKTNQLMNLIASVLRAFGEMRKAAVQNFL